MARKKKKGKVIQMQSKMNPSKYIQRNGRRLDIHEVLWTSELLKVGKGNIFVSRKKNNGDIIIGSYMVDTYCLGVKDTFYKVTSQYEYDEYMQFVNEVSGFKMETLDTNYAFNLIYGALEYAEDLGIEPHKDFRITEYLLDAPETLEFVDIEFGLNGRPCYYYYEGDKKGKILSALNKSVGPDGYMYIDGEDESNFMMEDDSYDSINDFIEIAESEIEDIEDRTIYLVMATLLHAIENLYIQNSIGFISTYNDKPDLLINDIKIEVSELFDETKNIENIISSCLEKYMIYKDIDFLLNEEFVIGFSIAPLGDEVSKAISHINMSQTGDKKIQSLITMLSKLFHHVSEINLDAKHIRSSIEKIIQMKSDFIYPIHLALTFLIDHEMGLGEIEFEKYDYSLQNI